MKKQNNERGWPHPFELVEEEGCALGDIAAADAAYRRLDVRSVRPVDPVRGEPVAMINNNMLVLVFGGDSALRARLVDALRPGSENVTRDQVEP